MGFVWNPVRRKQYLSREEKPLKTARPGLHSKKALLCVWWDQIGIIHFEVFMMGQTVTANIYCQQLERLREALITKRPALVNRRGIILQQDNARPHTAKVTHQKSEVLVGTSSRAHQIALILLPPTTICFGLSSTSLPVNDLMIWMPSKTPLRNTLSQNSLRFMSKVLKIWCKDGLMSSTMIENILMIKSI